MLRIQAWRRFLKKLALFTTKRGIDECVALSICSEFFSNVGRPKAIAHDPTAHVARRRNGVDAHAHVHAGRPRDRHDRHLVVPSARVARGSGGAEGASGRLARQSNHGA